MANSILRDFVDPSIKILGKGSKIRLPLVVFFFLLILSGVFLALSTSAFILNFRGIGFSVFSVLEKQTHRVTTAISSTITAARRIPALRSEYEALVKQFENYELMQRTNAEIRQENERLKEQLDFSATYEYENIPAYIIHRNPDPRYVSLTINKGSTVGIRKNMPVIAIQNGEMGLVGRIISVGRQTSLVMPVYDSQCNISARIRTTRDVGIVRGQGSLELPLVMSYVKKSTAGNFLFGDIVVTSGENGNYLRDIPLGTITRVDTVEYDSSLSIELSPIINFSQLETVIVVDQQNKGVTEGEVPG